MDSFLIFVWSNRFHGTDIIFKEVTAIASLFSKLVGEQPKIENNSPVLLDKGQVFKLKHGVTVVLLRCHKASYWDAVVIKSSHPSYPVGGYDICVFETELRAADTHYIPAEDL